MTKHFIKALAAATFAAVLVSGCAAQAPAVQAVSSSNAPEFEVTSTPASEQLEIKAAAAVKAAETKAAKVAAEAAAEAAKIAEIKAAADSAAAAAAEQIKREDATQAKAKAAAPPAAAVAPPKTAVAPAQGFHAWVNATLAKYGVSPGPGASFRVGSTAFCGGYMCTTAERYGTTVFRSVTTVSPGAIGNEFALIHEVAHQHGVGLRDTGGECAADVWTRQYVSGSIYC